jgi:hypothetical protein
MSSNRPEEAREGRLRRMAERQGFALRKSRRRMSDAGDYGNWWVTDPFRNMIVLGGDWGVCLDEVETFLMMPFENE